MPYKQTDTHCVVRLVALRSLSPATLAQCQALRAEAGQLWTDLVTLHAQARLCARLQGRWLSAGEFEQATKGEQYALHSQTIQALCQQLAANVVTAQELRRQELAEWGCAQTAYPQHPKASQTVVWKDQALFFDQRGRVGLKNGQGRPPLYLPLPDEDAGTHLRRVEVTWRADHYELCLTLGTGEPLPAPQRDGAVGGVDLGEGHIAAVSTTRRHALVISGRMLRSGTQGRTKRHAALQERVSLCQPGSCRAQRLLKRQAQSSAQRYRPQREILQQAARKVVDFCSADGVTQIAVGDVREIQIGVSLGKQTNQKSSQWPHGQFARYGREKAARLGISVEWIDERYLGCGAGMRRDVNGASNCCSKAATDGYGQVQVDTVKYLRPIGVAPLTRAISS